MDKPSKLIDKILEVIPGGIFGLLSVVSIILGELLAFLLFPGYNIFDNMISDLGVGKGGVFFNLGLLISGILIIPYYVHLAKSFQGENINENLRKYALLAAVISCITYALLGVFPAIEENIIIFYTHGILATISIACGLGYLLLYSILMYKAQNYSKVQAYHGFLVAAIYATFLMFWIPVVEWVLNLAILTWIIANSVYILYLYKQENLKIKDKLVSNEKLG